MEYTCVNEREESGTVRLQGGEVTKSDEVLDKSHKEFAKEGYQQNRRGRFTRW